MSHFDRKLTESYSWPFLFVGYRLYSASLIFSEFQKEDPNSCWSEKGGDTKPEEKLNGAAALRQDPGSYKEYA